jgi:tRNA nucleotidyltransferase (CCA-adding enzyme)
MKISPEAKRIAEIVEAAGGDIWVVGGACRDTVMGVEPRDFDFECFGISKQAIVEACRASGIAAKTAGAAYGIVIATVDGVEVEVSVADGDIETAAARRDITANSIYFRPATGEWRDPFGGREDIAAGVIRATPGFDRDPGRMMRVARFAARFGWTVEDGTAEMIRRMAGRMAEVSIERIWPEFAKAFECERPGDFIRAMKAIGIVGFWPEIAAMDGCEQDPIWHPEGDAFEHTACTMDAAAAICRRDGIIGEDRIAFVAGAMVHDFGKPATTVRTEDGRIASPAHAEVGVAIAERFFRRCGIAGSQVAGRAIAMTAEHMAHIAGEPSPRSARRMAVRIAARGATIIDIARIIEADASGRPPMPAGMPESGRAMVAMAEAVGVADAAPQRIVEGRHVMSFGVAAGPRVGRIVNAAFDAQVDGAFEDIDGGIAWVAERFAAIA